MSRWIELFLTGRPLNRSLGHFDRGMSATRGFAGLGAAVEIDRPLRRAC
jgi:hypothetical protein